MREFIKNLKVCYHSGFGDNLGKDFYAPCLARCLEYKRTTGDFTSNVIFDWGEALINVIDREDDKCVIKIIANPNLPEEDKITLKTVLENKNHEAFFDKITHNIFQDALDLVQNNLNREKSREIKLKIFCYLIATRKLILKFGFPKHVHNANVFHTKRGMFYFDDDLKVGFSGSSNETHGGHYLNIEDINIYNNLNGVNPHIEDIEKKFELSWDGKAPGFETRKLNQKTLDLISSYAPNKTKVKEYIKKFKEEFADIKNESTKDKIHDNFINKNTKIKENYLDILDKKWSFQEKARKIFIEKKWGLLEMATGTGKTRTALSIATQLINEKKINKIILQMYGSDLIKQWHENVNKWTLSKIDRDVRILNDEKEDIDFFLMNYENDDIDFLIIRQSRLPELLDKINNFDQSKTLIIHDEVHDLFAKKIAEKIKGKQNKFGYKLGLSATIREEFNKERERLLFNEIQGNGDQPIFEYNLKQAIEDGVLAQMKLVYEEYELYDFEIAKINRAYSQHKTDLESGMSKWEADEKRNMAIADVRKNAKNKIEVFEKKIDKLIPYLNRSFIFADETDYGDNLLNILIHKLDVRTHYGDNDKDNLARFSEGKINCIINVMKLSQGIDVQNLNSIVLFATPRGRQFIQRLGRVLRSDPNNDEKVAIVIDFFDKKQMKEKKGSDYNRFKSLVEYSEIKKNPQ